MTLVLTMCRLVATGTGGSGSFPALRDDMTHVDETGMEHIGGTGVVGSKGKRGAVFVMRLLTTAFLIGCCIIFDTIFDGGFVLPFEGQWSTSCAAMAGGSFSNEMAANCQGEHVNLLVCFLLTTVLFIDHFLDGITSA